MKRTHSVTFALAWALSFALVARSAPVSRSITVDGSFADWTEVLVSPDNVARDGDGSSVGCAASTDRDCPLPGRNVDLVRFAWTWDATYFYFYVERNGTSTTTQELYLYLDADHDGLLETLEPVLHITLPGSSTNASSEILGYVPSTPSGDTLGDASGFADGWRMPGTATLVFGGNPAPGQSPTPGGSRHEGAVRWQRLGLVPGTPLFFHVSLARGTNLPNDIEDNMGGPAGAVGDTGFFAVAIDGPACVGAAPGTTATLTHRAAVAGNLSSVLALRAVSSSGLDLTWRRDLDADGVAETVIALDAGGDGVFTGAGDVITPDGDTDGDMTLDTGLLGMGKDALVAIDVPLGPGDAGLKETVTVETWATEDTTQRASVPDVIRCGDQTVAKDETRQAAPGERAWIPHVVSENTGAGLTVELSTFSARSWPWWFHLDPNGDGDPADAVALPDADGNGRPELALQPFQTRMVFAATDVPAMALQGQVENAVIRVHDAFGVISTASDRVIVSPKLDLAPSYTAALGTAHYGGAGDSIYFAHRLVNGSGRFSRFVLQAACDLGWPVTVLLDPDGDGRPGDAYAPVASEVVVPVSGGEAALLVRVDVPDTGRQDDVGTVTFGATAYDDARITSAVTDEAIVALVRTYDDPTATMYVSALPECSTVYAVATGLTPGVSSYMFTWRDPAGMVLRMQSATADASGRCQDSMNLPAGLGGAGFEAEIQGWVAGSWVDLDGSLFSVGDALAGTLAIGTPRADAGSGDVSGVVTLSNGSYDQDVTGATIAWRIVSPDGATILDASGAFVPFTGIETTQRDVVSLMPRQSLDLPLRRSGVAFPATGTWHLRAARVMPCGAEQPLGEADFAVADDPDLDGVTTPDEIALGTHPQDADSDDDGLSDGAEGPGDADGDGTPDALECDADGDGLPDGLESGIAMPGPATDRSIGCFRADADCSTTTDPHAADTDGGGVPDGEEDLDGDGAIDAGEMDPRRPADDMFIDRDADGLSWIAEQQAGTSDRDADSDDDGLLDGADGANDTDGDGRLDLLDCDSDDDGILDGTEAGIVTPGADTDRAAGCFLADADPTTATDPDLRDSDAGGVDDGVEDADRDGLLDAGETGATDWMDDWPACSRARPAEVLGLRVAKDGGDAILTWEDAADPCVVYAIESGDGVPSDEDAATGVAPATWRDARPLAPGVPRFYLVRASSWLGGEGPDGT